MPLYNQPLQEEVKPKKASMGAAQMAERAADAAGISLGPIGLTIGSDLASTSRDEGDDSSDEASSRPQSIASLTTDEWRELYEREGRVDLWVKEEFNSGSRLVVSAGGGSSRAAVCCGQRQAIARQRSASQLGRLQLAAA
jgi:hypothetical protein